MTAAAELAPGRVLAGYRIEALIGSGGMGVVYRATQLSLEREVALKIILTEYARDAAFRQRFEREARVAASLDHPNILPIHETGEQDGLLFIAMRYVRGGDLGTLLRTNGALAPDRAAQIVSKVGDALDYAHDHGLVHRDVKPTNILLDAHGDTERVYLADFGLARSTTSDTALTRTGGFVGTVGYASPEQIQGHKIDGRADVYALGCLFYECLTGRRPFPRDTEVAVIWAHLRESPPRPSTHDERLAVVDPIVARAMAKRPEGRYERAGQLGRDGAGALAAGAAPRIRGIGVRATSRRLRSKVTDRRAATIIVAVLAALAVATLAAVRLSSSSNVPAGAGAVRGDPIPVGRLPSGVAVAGETVWVASEAEGTLSMVDAASGEARGETERLDSGLGPVVAGAGSVWALNVQGWIGRVDVASGAVAERRTVVPYAQDLAFGAGALWVLAARPGRATVIRVDPRTQRTTAEIGQIGDDAVALAFGARFLWVLRSNEVLRIDPRTNAVSGQPISAGRGLAAIATDADTVWITSTNDDTLSRIDARQSQVIGLPIPVGREPSAIATGEDGVWVVNEGDGSVSRVDPHSGRVVGTPIVVGGVPSAVATGFGSVWITRNSNSTLARVEPGSGVT